MGIGAARRLVFLLLGLYAVFLTWPGMVPFNRIRPLVLGLPFSMFWIALWVVLLGLAFALLNYTESRAEAASEVARPPRDVSRAGEG